MVLVGRRQGLFSAGQDWIESRTVGRVCVSVIYLELGSEFCAHQGEQARVSVFSLDLGLES